MKPSHFMVVNAGYKLALTTLRVTRARPLSLVIRSEDLDLDAHTKYTNNNRCNCYVEDKFNEIVHSDMV